MDFDFSEEQRQLGDAMQRFVAGEYGFEKRKKILASPDGFSREVWQKLGELGFLALLVPEEHGGMGGGPVEMLLVMNAIGKGLLLEPYLPSAILATLLLSGQAFGGDPHAGGESDLLSSMATGEIIAVPAHTEFGARYDLRRVATKASKGGALTGEKAVVLHAPAAHFLIVSARTSGNDTDERGISLFLVERDAPGLSLRSYRTMDGQRAADVKLDNVPAKLIAEDALPRIEAAFDVGIAALCAEAVGALQASLDATIEYTKTRQQFGQPIAKFQVLQHRMADMFIQVEQARSMSFLAAMRCTDKDARERSRNLSAAKALVGQAARFVGQQSIQLHGGMGMTDELAISHHFRRLTAIELTLGDTEHHLERFAKGRA
jgi:alkylation response protein AidB-like acyl-CoA dehydrogenase